MGGASFLNQSQNVIKQNQCNPGLLSTFNLKLLYLRFLSYDKRTRQTTTRYQFSIAFSVDFMTVRVNYSNNEYACILFMLIKLYSFFTDFKGVGCYNDNPADRAIQTIEGTDSILDGEYLSSENPVAKCAIAAIKKGFHMFALQHGGWCAASATAVNTFDKYGKSTACLGDGEGGLDANQVYLIKGKELNMIIY